MTPSLSLSPHSELEHCNTMPLGNGYEKGREGDPRAPKVLLVLLEHRVGNTLGQSFRHVVRPWHLVELEYAIVHQLQHSVNTGIDMATPLPVNLIVRHHDAGSIVLPHT
eukprot:238330-Rhodomonas_salina.1